MRIAVLDGNGSFLFGHNRAGPYIARSASDNTDDWPYWYVAGEDGRYNGLILRAPGAKFVDRAAAETIATALNKARSSKGDAP